MGAVLFSQSPTAPGPPPSLPRRAHQPWNRWCQDTPALALSHVRPGLADRTDTTAGQSNVGRSHTGAPDARAPPIPEELAAPNHRPASHPGSLPELAAFVSPSALGR